MLTGAGFRDELLLAHPLREQRLAEAVVDLVRAGVVQVLALEVNLRAADLVAQALGVEDGARAAGELLLQLVQLIPEGFVLLELLVLRGDLLHDGHERRGEERAAVLAEKALGIGRGVRLVHHGRGGGVLGGAGEETHGFVWRGA